LAWQEIEGGFLELKGGLIVQRLEGIKGEEGGVRCMDRSAWME